ncbi:rhamnogalacturonan acetylesterase [Gynuella sp.]|uniref:rhamnogalacturonan acetylesterase n=1 Tax=Gynuella sp. TaxID=2969146 RepID=UPI003D136259
MTDSATLQIFMAGDSTMAIKDPSDYPETGWGVPFAKFFDKSVNTINLARNGRSTKTFISEGRWQAVIDNIHAGDYVFIQFGHNDEVPSKVERYTTPEEYKANLNRFIKDVETADAHAILMTPVVRRKFDQNDHLVSTHPYAQLVREVAAEHPEITFIDMEKVTHDYFENLGPKDSELRFMHLQPGAHPNYPDGRSDNTHYTEFGAREVAQLVLAELRKINHPLTKYIRVADPKHLKK